MDDIASDILHCRRGLVFPAAGIGAGALVGIALALYGAMKGVKTLIEGMNIAYDEDETRGFIRLNLTAFLLTLGLLIGFLASLVALTLN